MRRTAEVKRRLSQPFYAAKTAKRFVFGAVKSLFAVRNLYPAIRLCTYTSILYGDPMRRVRARQPYSRKVGRLSGVWHGPILASECVPARAGAHKPSVIVGRSAKSASALSNILDKRLIFIHDDVIGVVEFFSR